MYGNLIAAAEILSQEEKDRYKACYCGLCRCLEKKYGELYRLTLSFDLTFLALFLNAMYEPEETCGETFCLVHPKEKGRWWQSEYTEYAADITVALAYLKCVDDKKDEKKLSAAAGSRILKEKYSEVKAKYSRLFVVVEEELRKLAQIEMSNRPLPDECSHCFGRIMGSIFSYKEDYWKTHLYSFGYSLGEYIYLVDAAVDLPKDIKRNNYNPFSPVAGNSDNGKYFKEILEITLGDCVKAFDSLPIVQDAGIIKNILCFGLWQNFYKQYPNPNKEEILDEPGSV